MRLREIPARGFFLLILIAIWIFFIFFLIKPLMSLSILTIGGILALFGIVAIGVIVIFLSLILLALVLG